MALALTVISVLLGILTVSYTISYSPFYNNFELCAVVVVLSINVCIFSHPLSESELPILWEKLYGDIKCLKAYVEQVRDNESSCLKLWEWFKVVDFLPLIRILEEVLYIQSMMMVMVKKSRSTSTRNSLTRNKFV